MRFEWDENKRLLNIRKHGFDFVDIETVFEYQTSTFIDERIDYREKRFLTTGLLNGRVVVIAHTQEHEIIRIISVRKATKNEQDKFFKDLAN